jgi:isoquinoline 1-oxidoreductase beta subunit
MEISRRKFIQLSTVTTAFLVVGCKPGSNEVVASVKRDLKGVGLNQFISIGSDGTIIMFNHRPEMGQGTFQAIPMILAEELEVDIKKVHIKQSAANRELYGSQMVVGSRSIQTEFEKLRKMGATAREMLRQAAANRWDVSLEECIASDGVIKNTKGDQLKYQELVAEASTIEAPESPILKKPADFKIIGTSVPRQDIPLKTNGEAKFGIDISVPACFMRQ